MVTCERGRLVHAVLASRFLLIIPNLVLFSWLVLLGLRDAKNVGSLFMHMYRIQVDTHWRLYLIGFKLCSVGISVVFLPSFWSHFLQKFSPSYLEQYAISSIVMNVSVHLEKRAIVFMQKKEGIERESTCKLAIDKNVHHITHAINWKSWMDSIFFPKWCIFTRNIYSTWQLQSKVKIRQVYKRIGPVVYTVRFSTDKILPPTRNRAFCRKMNFAPSFSPSIPSIWFSTYQHFL